jgi:hypothetical protein
MRSANIEREAYRPEPDYPVQKGLTVPAIALVACLVLAVAVIAAALWVNR